MLALKIRSYFSLMGGTMSPLDLCKLTKKMGYTHLALTDTDNLYGLPAFLKACRTTGITPIIGAEITSPENSAQTIICLVKDDHGFSNLCSLITQRHCNKDFSFSELPPSYAKGLILLSEDLTTLKELHRQHLEIVGDIGHQPTEAAQKIRNWCNKHQRPAIYTMNSSIGSTSERELFYLLQAIRKNTSLSQAVDETVPPQAIEPISAYNKRFSIWPEILQEAEKLIISCSFSGPATELVMPPWQSGKNISPAQILRQETYKGAQKRYGLDLSEPVIERIEYELEIIEQMGFSSYFLIVRDIVHPKEADGKRYLRRVCGRGSGAASLVAYCLQITNVCPVRYNLYFERFLNPGRKDPPDIDIDFAWDERDDILSEVLTHHKDHVAMVCNHVYFKPRMAIRETAKAYGIPGYEISRITKKLPWIFREDGETLQSSINRAHTLKDYEITEPWPEILALAEKLIGLPRNLSVHPGGVIITPEKLDRYVPIEMAPKGVPIIQWEKDGAEDMGLVKIDLLGNRSLGVIRDAITNVQDNGGTFSEDNWVPEDDHATKELVANGKTMGCFYIESPAMRLLQKKAACGIFDQLVLQSSIIRPAANEFVREYVRRLHTGDWPPLHPMLEGVLDETFGLMVYQEDVSKVAVTLAGFSHAKADGLRKILSKKDRELRLRDYRKDFQEGCRQNQIHDDIIDKMWSMIISFDGYSFCKPHSASYAKVSYQAAYLKRHFPAEFMAAVISNQGGFYSTFGYVSEAKRLGLNVLPPDINRSKYRWQGNEDTILTGLLSIKNLSFETAQRIIEKRKETPYTTIADFYHRIHPSEDEATSLIHAGALDSLDLAHSREKLLWSLACLKQSANTTTSLFPPSVPTPPQLPPQSHIDKLRYEYKSLGFLCSTHPIMMFTKKTQNMTKGYEIASYIGKKITIAGWLLTGKIVSTKTGDAMEFLTFEDETATFEATFFPKVYRKFAHILSSNRGYILRGLVEDDFGAQTLTVETVHPLRS